MQLKKVRGSLMPSAIELHNTKQFVCTQSFAQRTLMEKRKEANTTDLLIFVFVKTEIMFQTDEENLKNLKS